MSGKEIVKDVEACTRDKDENDCVAGHLWDSLYPDSICYAEKRLRFQMQEILCQVVVITE